MQYPERANGGEHTYMEKTNRTRWENATVVFMFDLLNNQSTAQKKRMIKNK